MWGRLDIGLSSLTGFDLLLFCNQRACANLVIRRAVEIEGLQLSLWSLGLVWFIVAFHDVPFQ